MNDDAPVDGEDVARGESGAETSVGGTRKTEPGLFGCTPGLGRLRQRLLRLRGAPGAATGLRRGRRGRRAWRWSVHRGRGGRLGVADEDLGARGQAAVIGGEDDVERVDCAAGVLRAVGDGRLRDLLEHDQIAPVARADAQVRRRGHLASRRRRGSSRLGADRVGARRGRLRARGDALGGHLAVEERDAEDVADTPGRRRCRWRARRRSTRARRCGRASRRRGRRSRRRRRSPPARAPSPRPRPRRAGRERESRDRARRRRRSPAPRARWRRSPQQRATRRSGAVRSTAGTRGSIIRIWRDDAAF